MGMEGGMQDIVEMRQRDRQRDRHSCERFFVGYIFTGHKLFYEKNVKKKRYIYI